MSLKELDWENLILSIHKKSCLLILGAGMSASFLPLAKDLAKNLAIEYDIPFKEGLSKVAQWLAIKKRNEMFPKVQICKMIAKVPPPDFTKYNDSPHAILSKLDLPIYITTNYDTFMEEALKSQGKEPVTEYLIWNKYLEQDKESINKKSSYQPIVNNPLVYHLHGTIDMPSSIVLTTSDYVQFLVTLVHKGADSLLPVFFRRSLAGNQLLYIGYSLQDINFQVILGVMSSPLLNPGITIFPSLRTSNTDFASSSDFIKIQSYIETDFKSRLNTKIFWSTAEEFTTELRNRL